MANKVLKKSKAIAARRAAGGQKRVFGARGKPAAAAGLSAVATKKLVNKLVKVNLVYIIHSNKPSHYRMPFAKEPISRLFQSFVSVEVLLLQLLPPDEILH